MIYFETSAAPLRSFSI